MIGWLMIWTTLRDLWARTSRYPKPIGWAPEPEQD